MNALIKKPYKLCLLMLLAMPVCMAALWAYGQVSNAQELWKKLKLIEADTVSLDKATQLKALKKKFEEGHFQKDSVYARILDRIGVYEYSDNKILTPGIVYNTTESIRINTSGKRNVSPKNGLISLMNLSIFYRNQKLYAKALKYYDSTIFWGTKLSSYTSVSNARYSKGIIFTDLGDYTNAIEEDIIGLEEARQANDSQFVAKFYNQRSQANFFQGQSEKAKADADIAYTYAKAVNDNYEIATAIKNIAFAVSESPAFKDARQLFLQAIQVRKQFVSTLEISKQSKINAQIADDYTDLGNYYLNKEKNYNKATESYTETLRYAKQANDSERISKAFVNLGQKSFLQKKMTEAGNYYVESLKCLKVFSGNNFFLNPAASQLNHVGNKELILMIMSNKTELLLNLLKQNQTKKYIDFFRATALLTDSLITLIRHEQSGEQSKLYWRNSTRDFFTNAIEASYITGDAELTFFLMEKSRSVLLNDKVNELGALARLPLKEALAEQEFKTRIIEQQQKLSSLPVNTPEYAAANTKLLKATNAFDQYVRSLEDKYPVYFQYKYDDAVPSLSSLQNHLSLKKETFIHYFINDTVAYILSIAPRQTKIVKLSKKDFSSQQLSKFVALCSNAAELNSNYPAFAILSNSLYKILFQQLLIPKGRVVVSPDNFLLPFEALCKDTNGRQFLLYDYAFSYVYSARFLLKKFDSYPAKENFIGFAPVSFQPSLQVMDLKNSADALEQSASNYNSSSLLTYKNASKRNFLTDIGDYSIVNVFSHAWADSSDNEPLLFMQDSVIKLSELQLLNNPATRLVVLSACQTNVGKNATGEGIYSLARGFTSAGIPSVAATLWKADEQTIYTISQKFHEYLSKGICKDEALQKAKLYFMQKGHEKLLPYYWANMILIGDAEPIDLATAPHYFTWLTAGIMLLLFIIIFIKRRRLLKVISRDKY